MLYFVAYPYAIHSVGKLESKCVHSSLAEAMSFQALDVLPVVGRPHIVI